MLVAGLEQRHNSWPRYPSERPGEGVLTLSSLSQSNLALFLLVKDGESLGFVTGRSVWLRRRLLFNTLAPCPSVGRTWNNLDPDSVVSYALLDKYESLV
jgi:hypothetical protein